MQEARPTFRKCCEPLSLNVFYCRNKARKLCKSNCRSIEVSLLYPTCSAQAPQLSVPPNSSETENCKVDHFSDSPDDHLVAAKDAFGILSLVSSREPPETLRKMEETFPFMDLPVEIRLKVYEYLLPARTHTIVTQYPHNGYFFNTSTIPTNSAQSFYPFGRSPPNDRLTTYKVLNANFRADYPFSSIFPHILRVSRQIRAEAEPVLYGSSKTIFDFGVHIDAVKPFFGDRSNLARSSVKRVSIAREIPEGLVENSAEWKQVLKPVVDPTWNSLCGYLSSEFTSLQNLDLTVWSSSGSLSSLPMTLSQAAAETNGDEASEAEAKALAEQERLWAEWEWTRELLRLKALSGVKVTWWGFDSAERREGKPNFDSWLARRMVGDALVRDRMIKAGVVVEGVVVIRGFAGQLQLAKGSWYNANIRIQREVASLVISILFQGLENRQTE